MQLQGNVAIVTGAAQGIGKSIAETYIKEGAKVVLADIDPKGAETAVALGKDAKFVKADVGSSADCAALVEATVEAFGRVDILVNNAAIIHTADFLDLKEEDFDRVLRVNMKGSFLMGQAAARQMVKQGEGGNIINMSSVNGLMAIPNQTPYNVSKGAINQLTRNMALALAPHNIRVNAIGPGSIMTDLLKVVMDSEEVRQRILGRTPMGRCGEVEEIASIAVFLASAASSYVTGQIIYADGGRMALNYTVPVAS
jgi:NAD(P)-dependent dehydrogenase (short-subunit alcohol dehydrogenase family)